MSAPQTSLQGQVVLVTGAASGIGAATALELLQRGARPVLVDCDAEPLARMAARCGSGTLHLVADVTDLAAMEHKWWRRPWPTMAASTPCLPTPA